LVLWAGEISILGWQRRIDHWAHDI